MPPEIKQDNPLLVDTGRGFSVFYRNKHLYNSKLPAESALRKVSGLKILPKTVIFLPSPLLFYGTAALLDSLPENCFVIAYEIDPALFSIHKSAGICVPDDRRLVYLNNDIGRAVKKLKDAGIRNFRRVTMVTLSGGFLLHREEYRKVFSILETAVKEFWQNRMTEISMSHLWLRNIFLNTSEITYSSVKDIQFSFTGIEGFRPVIVTGAGESLERALPLIKRNRGNFALLSVDTAVSALLEAGIIPDYIVAVDAQIYNLFDFTDLKDSSVPLFFDITGYPAIARNFKGTLYPFLSNFSSNNLIKRIKERLTDLEVVPPLGSVGITAVYIALKITGGPVIHTGLDFSYHLGKSHARGTPYHRSVLAKTGRFLPVEDMEMYFKRPFFKALDKNGDICITNTILSSYAVLMKDSFKGENRLYDIGTCGLESSGKRITDITESEMPFRTAETGKRHSSGGSFSAFPAESFLKEELERINELHSVLYGFLSGKEKNKKAVSELLASMDYLHVHFPDYPPEDETSPDYIKRVLLSAEYFRGILLRNPAIRS